MPLLFILLRVYVRILIICKYYKNMNTDMNFADRNAQIVMRAEGQSLHLLFKFVKGICRKYDYSQGFRMETELVLEELLSNIINYAYSSESGTHEVALRFAQLNADEVSFELEDSGVPFDPTGYKRVNIEDPLEKREVGGLGIHLVRQKTKSMSYRRENNRNILTIVKSLN